MAGHSKWANIKHRKGRADAKKGKIFSRLAKEIISAVKLGGEDAKSNPRLKLAIQKARDANFPNESIERNIKRALSDDQADYTEVTYELYGHGGVGLIVDIMTDNRNRASSDMRIATNKRGGNIATPGAVAFNFDRKGILQVSKQDANKKPVVEDDLFLAATEAGAEDFEASEQGYVVVTDPAQLFNIKEALQGQQYVCEEAELVMVPKSYIECNEEDAKANLALIEWLEELEDVDTVHHNLKE
jgi:YebC/PmpR family DNA-binding regulatory protein